MARTDPMSDSPDMTVSEARTDSRYADFNRWLHRDWVPRMLKKHDEEIAKLPTVKQ